MRIPFRKAGKYTNLKLDPHITKVKFNELKRRLEKLKNFFRPQAIKESKRLAEMGDFSENAAYSIAKGRLRSINEKIFELEEYLKTVVMINSVNNIDKVKMGHKVTIKIAGKQKTYLILGSSETNPRFGVISYSSPIGSALLGRKVGDKVKIKLAQKIVECQIIGME